MKSENKELIIFMPSIEMGGGVEKNFIILKLNSLFGYNTDEDTKNEYNQRLEEYNFFSELYDGALQENKQIYENEERALSLQTKQKDFYEKIVDIRTMTSEYNETGNKEYLQLISDKYIKELKPLVDEIQKLRFQHSEVEVFWNAKFSPFDFQKIKFMENWQNTLYQYVASIDSMDSFAKKQEKVLAFNI